MTAMGRLAQPLLDVRDLRVWFPTAGRIINRGSPPIRAVDGVSFSIRAGTTLALVGESGSGKTTVARAVTRLVRPDAGKVIFDGEDLTAMRAGDLRVRRRKFQMVFQDPSSSLDPHQRVEDILTEPLNIHRIGSTSDRRQRVAELLNLVGLNASSADRYPHEFSGGQRQRIGIARALAVGPMMVVCDEPISSLDVSIRAQISNLLLRLQRELALTYLFIAHDLAVVRQLADTVAVMYLGEIVEYGPNDDVIGNPRHPYTRALLSAVPSTNRGSGRKPARRIVLSGDIPSPANPPSGCRFHTRCWLYQKLNRPETCRTVNPTPEPRGGHTVSCHYADKIAR